MVGEEAKNALNYQNKFNVSVLIDSLFLFVYQLTELNAIASEYIVIYT